MSVNGKDVKMLKSIYRKNCVSIDNYTGFSRARFQRLCKDGYITRMIITYKKCTPVYGDTYKITDKGLLAIDDYDFIVKVRFQSAIIAFFTTILVELVKHILFD